METLLRLRKSIAQVTTLSEIYSEIVNSRFSKDEAVQKRLEAEYARDQILKLSVHIKHLLKEIEDAVK